MPESNSTNLKGEKWWQEQMSCKISLVPVYPEEDYQLEFLPLTLLYLEIGKRLGISDNRIKWKGKEIDFSAVSDRQLLHHFNLKIEKSSN